MSKQFLKKFKTTEKLQYVTYLTLRIVKKLSHRGPKLDLNIKTLTLYAFSTENWQRAAHEVASLMKLYQS